MMIEFAPYNSTHTGQEIDDAVDAIQGMKWKADVISISSGIDGSTGVSYSQLSPYPLVVFTGYKKGLGSDFQRCSVIISTAALSGSGSYINVPLAAQSGDYYTLMRTMHLWNESGTIKWTTLQWDSGDSLEQGFVAQRIEGLKLSRG